LMALRINVSFIVKYPIGVLEKVNHNLLQLKPYIAIASKIEPIVHLAIADVVTCVVY